MGPHVSGATGAALLLAALTAAAFWRSLLALVPLAAAENAAGLAPVAPLLAVWLVVGTARRRRRAGRPQVGAREGVIDLPAAGLLLGVAGWLLWRAPAESGWYFWSYRLDLLAAACFAVGIAALLWGVQTLLWHRLAVLFTFLMWPEPLVRVQDAVAAPLAFVTAVLARPLAVAAGARLLPDSGDPAVFVSAGPFPWTIVVGDVCSGLNAGVAVLLVSVPAAVFLGVGWRRALPWALAGAALALLGNVLRVAALLVVAGRSGAAFAMGTVHPLLGAVLLLLTFSVLWRFAPAERAATVSAPAAQGAPRAKAVIRLRSPRFAAALALSGVFALASAHLAIFEPLPPLGPPGGSVAEPLDYLRLPAGWQVEDQGLLAWQNLFGADSHSYALNLRSAEGALVKAQYVATPSRSRLQTFGLEACQVYHGEDVVGRRTVDLGAGSVAVLIDTWNHRLAGATGRLSLVYWQAPFALQGTEMHARLALFVTGSDEALLPPARSAGTAPGGALFDRADEVLLDLARGITRGVLDSATPGVIPG